MLRTFAIVIAGAGIFASVPSTNAWACNDDRYPCPIRSEALGSASSAFAQRPADFRRTLVTIAQSAPMHSAQAQLEPGDPELIGVQSSTYTVSGIALGAIVRLDSSAFRDYKCSPSDQFVGFTWCQKTRQEKERRGKFSSTYSILYSRGGVAVYLDRYLEPAFFGAREADDDIRQYSRNIGETARITRMPQRAGFYNGILASWGKVELEPLDNDSINRLAEGRRPTTKGFVVDFIGDFARSAKNGLPIYRISGGAGFVWVASFDQRGRGTLRLTAVDASVLAPATTPNAPIETVENAKEKEAIADSTIQLSRGEAEKEFAEQAKIDAERGREDAEKARDEVLRANADIDKAAAEERAKVNAVLAQLEAEKSAAEAEARVMEVVAYGGVIGLIVLVLIVASARSQNMHAAWLHRRPKSLKSHHLHPIQG